MKAGKRFKRARRVRWWLVFLDRADVSFFITVLCLLMAVYFLVRLSAISKADRARWAEDNARIAALLSKGGQHDSK